MERKFRTHKCFRVCPFPSLTLHSWQRQRRTELGILILRKEAAPSAPHSLISLEGQALPPAQQLLLFAGWARKGEGTGSCRPCPAPGLLSSSSCPGAQPPSTVCLVVGGWPLRAEVFVGRCLRPGGAWSFTVCATMGECLVDCSFSRQGERRERKPRRESQGKEGEAERGVRWE